MNKYIFLIFLLIACGSDKITREDYGSFSKAPTGLTLTINQHGSGWGKKECFLCHNNKNIHIRANLSQSSQFITTRTLIEEKGVTVCSSCHGNNGAEDNE